MLCASFPILIAGAGEMARVRQPIAAGLYYPAGADQLRAAVSQYITEAETIPVPGPVVGCVVPHSSYRAAGSIMASAFKYIQPGQYKRVIVLAPALHSEFRGCSVPSLRYYRTPLGDVELDGPAVRRICVNGLIAIRGLVYREQAYSDPRVGRTALHEKEPAIEVILPFLQVQLGEFQLVPIVVGTLKKVTGEFDEPALNSIVNTLREIVDEHTLVVACSDFTRYGASNNFTPQFTTGIVEGISALDQAAIRLIEERRVRGFQAYLKDTQNTISGPEALCVLMRLMPSTSAGVMVDYDLTARMTGNPRASVSYASIVFIDGMRERSTRPEPIRITDGVRDAARAAEAAPVGPAPQDQASGPTPAEATPPNDAQPGSE
ncbi:MAG: AmmeMemoRadiSam system protein B [Candidatus Hydrogenedentes bacterium]|nr:AmmeMemoRadiSam system protein B [Candidatus Hydrogenedentota bacterium]